MTSFLQSVTFMSCVALAAPAMAAPHHSHHSHYRHHRHHHSGASINVSFVTGYPMRPVYYQQPVYVPQPVAYYPQERRYCREYQSRVRVGSRWQNSYGLACQQPDGNWEIQM